MQNALNDLARFIEAHADETLSLDDLAARIGLSPFHLQRRFKAHFGISPKAYQDAARHRTLKAALRAGPGIAGAIFEAGYGSTSRVYGRSPLGMDLKTYQQGGAGEVIHYAVRKTVLGLVIMAATPKGVCCVQFGEQEPELVDALQVEFPKAVLTPSQAGAELDEWMSALEEHLARKGPRPDLPLDLRGTAFQQTVWRFLTTLKDDQCVTYSHVAEAIGAPKAVRATASGCARNRIAVLVPCHLVLRSDGGLGGYRWGLARKTALMPSR